MHTKNNFLKRLGSLLLMFSILTSMVILPLAHKVDALTVTGLEENTHNMFIAKVPKYSQTNYNCPYGEFGTVSSHGCGITCLSMVATYLLNDPSLTPDVLAAKFGKYNTICGSKWILFEDSAEALGLGEVKRVYEWNSEVENALKNGQLVISRQGYGLFTGGGHFILLTGMTKDGKVLVHDPYGGNWNKANLKDKFKNGFDPVDISQSGSPYWIYPKKTIDSVPKYDQLKYSCFNPDDAAGYNRGTAITSFSMVATYLKDDPTLSPNYLNVKFRKYATPYGVSGEMFTEGAKTLKIGNVDEIPSWNTLTIYEALKNGQIVISSQFGELFGENHHYVILVGLTDDNKIIVHDPDSRNWNKPELSEKFKNGFTISEIFDSSGMYWVFEKKA